MKKLFKTLLCATALFTAAPLASCSSFFGTGSEVTISSFKTEVDDFGNTVVVVEFADGSDPIRLTIPSGKAGIGIASIEQTQKDGDTILTISYIDGSDPTVVTIPGVAGAVKSITSLENEDGSLTVNIELNNGDPIEFIVPSNTSYVSIDKVDVVETVNGTTVTISYTGSTIPDTVISIPKVKGINYVIADDTNSSYYYITFYYSDGTSQQISLAKPEKPNTWLSDYGTPSMAEGNVGDFYYDKQTTTIYQKVSAIKWEVVTRLTSPETTYTVTFDANGGNFNAGTVSHIQTVKKGDTFYNSENSNAFPSVFYANYDDEGEVVSQKRFIGWYTSKDQNDVNATHFTDLTPVTCNITLYAWWAEN